MRGEEGGQAARGSPGGAGEMHGPGEGTGWGSIAQSVQGCTAQT